VVKERHLFIYLFVCFKFMTSKRLVAGFEAPPVAVHDF
jgi:hypothetical protein